jgi:hypothetical protein
MQWTRFTSFVTVCRCSIMSDTNSISSNPTTSTSSVETSSDERADESAECITGKRGFKAGFLSRGSALKLGLQILFLTHDSSFSITGDRKERELDGALPSNTCIIDSHCSSGSTGSSGLVSRVCQ